MKRKKWLIHTMFMTLFFLLAPIVNTYITPTAIASAATITLSSRSVTLDVGTSKALKIIGTSRKPTWSTSKSSVAAITSAGTVTAKAAGTATITANVGGKKYYCTVTSVVPIKLSNTAVTLAAGNSAALKVTGTAKTISWSSSNSSIASISSKGALTAKASGAVTITASVAGKKLTCLVTVLKLSDKTYSLDTGSTYKLKVAGT
jgi:uncharacterized protein YjdB